MTMREFVKKYGTRTVPLMLRHYAKSPEMAADLQSALEWFEAYAKAYDEGATNGPERR